MNIQEHRQSGTKIKIEHYRKNRGQFVSYSRKSKGKIDNNGGITVATVTKDGKTTKGVATCSDADNFCYRAGATIAVQRALSQIDE